MTSPAVVDNDTVTQKCLTPSRDEECDIKSLIADARRKGFVRTENDVESYLIMLEGHTQSAWYTESSLAFVTKVRQLHIIGKQRVIDNVPGQKTGSEFASDGYDGHHPSCTREHEDDELCCRHVVPAKVRPMTPEEELAFQERMHNPFL